MRMIVSTLALAALTALGGCGHQGGAATEEALPAATLRADFDALYEGLQRAHYDLYVNTPRAAYDQLYAETRAAIDRPMTRLEAHVLFQTFVAAGHVAHATIGFPREPFLAFREAGGGMFPLEVRLEGARVFVAEDLSGANAAAAGDEILALNGMPATAWRARLARHISADTHDLANAQIEPLFGALLWLELGEVESFDLRLRRVGGGEDEVRLPARTRAEMRAAAQTAPPQLSLDIAKRAARVTPEGVAYLRPGIFMELEGANPDDPAAFHAFIDETFAGFMAADARALLIDLRDNPGGHSAFSDHMIAWFADAPFRFTSDFRIRVSAEATASNAARLAAAPADSISGALARAYEGAANGQIVPFPIPLAPPRAGARFAGPVYVLINRRSFSNAVLVAAIVQDYGFGRILGEATADLATTYGAMEHFTLPHTGLIVGFPKALILRPNGDPRPQGVTPDIAIATPLPEPASDPVLEEALRIAGAGR